mmetsp:Transcript_15154/g.32720  ORF Transcript_15154/g.32720 Transcript_15154/m.32720 type:complete len:203 (-) Transcript_15154:57-665(-)
MVPLHNVQGCSYMYRICRLRHRRPLCFPLRRLFRRHCCHLLRRPHPSYCLHRHPLPASPSSAASRSLSVSLRRPTAVGTAVFVRSASRRSVALRLCRLHRHRPLCHPLSSLCRHWCHRRRRPPRHISCAGDCLKRKLAVGSVGRFCYRVLLGFFGWSTGGAGHKMCVSWLIGWSISAKTRWRQRRRGCEGSWGGGCVVEGPA